MVSIQKNITPACCGKTRISWVLNVPLKPEHLSEFNLYGFTSLNAYREAGMLYIESGDLIATGVFGLSTLNIKCKNKNCDKAMIILENCILEQF